MINQLKKINTVSTYTFFEIFKSRIIINVLFIGLFLGLIAYVASEFTFGVPQRVALDFGFGTLSLVSTGVSIFLGVGLLAQEIENRTLYMVLSRPISRSSFLLGRILGMIWIQVLIIFILAIFSLSIFFMLGGVYDSMISWNFLFIFLESLLILLSVIFFSLIANKVIAVCNTIVILVCGHVLNDTKLLTFTKSHPLFNAMINVYGLIFPNFYKLNIKDFVLYNQTLTSTYLISNLFYGLCYSGFLVCMICFIFEKKNLD